MRMSQMKTHGEMIFLEFARVDDCREKSKTLLDGRADLVTLRLTD